MSHHKTTKQPIRREAVRFPGKKTHCTLRIARETNAHRMYLERNTTCVTMTISTENHCATIVHLIAAINAFHNYILSAVFVIPLRLVLCTAKSFVVISLHFEQLFKVRFAIKFSLQSSIISKSVTKKIKNYPITLLTNVAKTG